jgi:periplasmic protein TonB
VYCDHCQTTVVDGAKFCGFCGGKLTDGPAADAMDPSQAPTVALTIGPCESCGAPSLPGSTLCLPCTRAFESILGTPPSAPAVTPSALAMEAATLLQPQAPVLPSAPGGSASQDAATLLVAATAQHDDDPLGDDEEYEDEPDDLMAEEAATVIAAPPPQPPPAPEPEVSSFSATNSVDWSTPAAVSSDHEGIVALPAWARKGPDADAEPAADAAPEAPGAEPVPWWERNGQQSPTAAAKSDVARYVPPPAAAPPASASLESTLARQAMRPKSPAAVAVSMPVVSRPPSASGNRSRTLVIGAALAGVAAIGTPVMWKLAFASRPPTVSALAVDPVAAPEPVTPRAERVHGTPAAAPAAAAAPRVYQDLQPVAPEPSVSAPVAAAAPPPATTHAPTKPAPATKKAPVTAAPEPVVAAPVAAPEPAPLLVATPPPVVAAPAAAAPPPAQVQAESVPLGQIFEVSQVETRPSVTSRFDPVLPARIGGTTPVVVIVRILVSPSGRAVESAVVKNPSNDTGLGAAAAATVRQWTFAPAKKKGQPVSCWVNVGVVFKAASGD